MLRCWAAKPVRPLTAPWDRDESFRSEVMFCQSFKTLLIGMQGPRYRAD